MERPEPEPGTNRLLLESLPDDRELPSFFEDVGVSAQARPPVIVSTRRSLPTILECWQSRLGPIASRTDVIAVSETDHSPSTRTPTTVDHDGRLTTVTATDLTGLGIAVSDALSDRDRGAPMQLWFDSITALLDVLRLEEVFRFLHVMTARVERADAIAIYHADPTVHGAETINTLAYLFDDVVEVGREHGPSE